MKPLTPVRVTRGQRTGSEGYVLEPHPNMPGYFWCRVGHKAPFPQVGGKKLDHHKDLVLSPSQLETL
ncbi:hypothetical protein LJY25_14625 [Hymenobacter sp. BT175]|uniref:hypothetical protein n=1 Tax=Hymenobacter translucens TaxID=2886507 RepID=UPI001D0E9FCD|nr:hypothetical protein [Hymenobacter translucens]MCC2547687.1 hypothetical protein [Hymenobacter translucens]